MSTFAFPSEMNSVAKAVAEERAREAGLSVGEWLERLVIGNAPTFSFRENRQFSVGTALTSLPQLMQGSIAMSTAIRPLEPAHILHRMAHAGIGEFANQPMFDQEKQEPTWSALQMVAAFPPLVDHAAILLSAAFAEADVDFRISQESAVALQKAVPHRWFQSLIAKCVHTSLDIRKALKLRWTSNDRAELLWAKAFVVLCDATPARQELLGLLGKDRDRASSELAKYLDLATQQFELAANHLAEAEFASSAELSNERRFDKMRAELLARAGGAVSLTDGAKLLGVTRQALHKRIKSGSALGMMNGNELVLPQIQWVQSGERTTVLPGLSDVLKLFNSAGGWSALQFLLDPDPNLSLSPIDALKAGRVNEVTAAARAFLGLDEG